MAEPRQRPLLDGILGGGLLGGGGLVGGIVEDVRSSARKRVVGGILNDVVRPRVDEVLGKRPRR